MMGVDIGIFPLPLSSEMRHLLISLLVFLACPAMAQKQISIIDDDTHKPIAYALIADSTGQISKSSVQGIAYIPKREGEIIIVHDSYNRVSFDYDSIPPVVEMHRRDYTLDEVEVIGSKDMKVDLEGMGIKLSKEEIADAKAKAAGGNLLAGLSDKIFNAKDRKRKKHREKLKKILEDY